MVNMKRIIIESVAIVLRHCGNYPRLTRPRKGSLIEILMSMVTESGALLVQTKCIRPGWRFEPVTSRT